MATKKKTATTIKQVGRTYCMLVNDHSGSIREYGLVEAARKSDEAQVATLKERAKAEGLDLWLGRVDFNSRAVVSLNPNPIEETIVPIGYQSDGGTALWDGVGLAIETLKAQQGAFDPATAYLVIVMTDGEENQSIRYSSARLKELIQETEKDGRWTIAFNVPKGRKQKMISQFGIPEENIREWEQTAAGMEGTQIATQSGTSNYLMARSLGATSVKNFYDVQTNLDKLKTSTVHTKLDDLSDKFAAYTVDKESVIKPFVEQATRREYKIGSTYYALTKEEKIQPNKCVLLIEKNKKAVWGGKQARELIGLPTDGVSHAKVSPGNHAQWDIFVESRSVNRILVRGTKILVDETLAKNRSPSWEIRTSKKAKPVMAGTP